MAEHALLSASGAKRWMACTPSARLESLFPEETSSYAAEGTRAHALAEQVLKGVDLYQEPPEVQQMLEQLEPYTDLVSGTVEGLEAEGKEPLFMTEVKVDFSKYVPGGFGTADALIAVEDTLYIIDLKYGAGVPVSAEDNPQLRLYALGAIEELEAMYDFEYVDMIICQPRIEGAPKSSAQLMSVKDLKDWGEQVVKPKAQAAWKGEGDYCPGDHCRFCKAREVCRARMGKYANLLTLQNKLPEQLASNKEIAQILREKKAIEKWLKDLEAYALQEMQSGVDFEGLKLAAGRSSMELTKGEEELAARLKDEGVEEALLYRPRQMVSRTDLKKLVDKTTWSEIEKEFYTKRQGAPKIDKAESRAKAWQPDNDFEGMDLNAFNE